ncbi:MAG: TetR/AcrR family transcriptional regulator [Eubacterium sp.]|nr:TetR/AcrR family transcriptional regulator [Eubacterium sp.]
MPPKFKFTKEEIIETALNMVRENGIESITARSLAERLGSSSKPVFSLFSNMDEVLLETVKAIRNIYNQYIIKGLSSEIPFKGVGTQYILFAIYEPKLFQVLFMRDLGKKADAVNTLPMIDDNYSEILSSVQKQYAFSEDEAKKLYKHLWIYTHGIASLIATGVCCFTAEEISSMMTEVCKSLVSQTRVEQNKV